ncbi:MAG: ATP-binding protein [Candidatus Eisenbacteria bacterium]|nr:ATP-binding protein [Candidatus Eisenbacteria bacterium]
MIENGLIDRLLGRRLPSPDQNRLVVLTGARQTGKTTLARREYGALRYLNLDALEYRDQLRAVSSFGWGRAVGPAVLDEAQKLPEVFEKLKYAFDEGQVRFSVLLGSAQILLLKQVRETLAGRAFPYELWPLMPCELAAGPGGTCAPPLLGKLIEPGDLDRVLSGEPEVIVGADAGLRRDAEQYLLAWGGMPALLPLDNDGRREWLKAYEITYLERDLADLSRLSDLEPFRKFQQLAALRSGQLLNYSELARDSGVSVETARRYLEYLRVSYQAWLLQPYSRNLTSRLVKTPKLYWVDPGLWRQMTGTFGTVSGPLFETFVASEVLKCLSALRSDARPSFYRTRSGMEVDLLLETAGGVLGMEIRIAERVTASDASVLNRLAAVLGEEWRGGLVIYRGEKIERLGPRTWAVPSWRLLS